jgi:hypothetical protein
MELRWSDPSNSCDLCLEQSGDGQEDPAEAKTTATTGELRLKGGIRGMKYTQNRSKAAKSLKSG